MASVDKMRLQKQRCSCMSKKHGCRSQYVAAGANMQLQEPIYDNRSQDGTAEALMWLQEQDVQE